MVDIAIFVILIGLLVVAAHFFAWLFSFTAVPDALLLIGVGLLLGPVLGVVSPDFFGDVGSVVLTVALVIMLFEAGISLRLDTMRGMIGNLMRLMVTSYVLATLGVAVLLYYTTDLPFLVALMAGAIVGDTTSSVVISLMKRLVLVEEAETLLVLESTFSDVLAVVVTIALLEAYLTGTFVASAMVWSAALTVGVAIAVGILVGLAWSHILDWVRNLQNSMFITAAMAFIVYGVMETLGFSGLIAVMMFGITMGSAGLLNHFLTTQHRVASLFVHPVALSKRERAFFSELVFLLQTFFFVYLGLSIKFSNSAMQFLAVGAVVLFLVLRIVAVRTSVSRYVDVRDVSMMAVMVPKGLTSVVLVLLLVQAQVPGAAIVQDFVYMVILWSVVMTALLVFLLEKTPLARLYARIFRGYGTESLPGIRRTL